jgi:creatinine amidohydrolase
MAPEDPVVAAELLLGKLTRREFRERMQSGELCAAILPVAAIEQHLEHLAMEHDWRSVNEVASAVAERLRPQVLVAQGLMAGISEHHMRHHGTLTLKPGTFMAVLYDLIESLKRAGFRNILVLNGHGGNTAPCRAVWNQFLQLTGVNLHFLPYWEVLGPESRKLLKTESIPGHAQEFETAVALARFPENVRTDIWNDQADPEPSQATAEAGATLFEQIVDGVSRYLAEMIDGRRQAEIPPFYL